jgi:3-oxoacyl-[acyl-carrier protein] reductase
VHGRTLSPELRQAELQIAELGGLVKAIPFDLLDSEGLASFVQDCWDWQGRVDTWLNFAGADILTGEARHLDFQKKLDRLWKVDVLATTILTREVGQRMKACTVEFGRNEPVADTNGSSRLLPPATERPNFPNGHFSIINMGWDQTDQGMEGESGLLFGLTKGAIRAGVMSMAQELAPAVRVNCVAPGWIQTEWSGGAPDYWQERAKGESLMARWGTTRDVAEVAVFLAGPSSSFVSGQIWKVNGGFRFGNRPKGEGQ